MAAVLPSDVRFIKRNTIKGSNNHIKCPLSEKKYVATKVNRYETLILTGKAISKTFKNLNGSPITFNVYRAH